MHFYNNTDSCQNVFNKGDLIYMMITDIREADGGKNIRKKAYKIYIDDSYAFLLYESELNQLQLSKGAEISTDVYNTIVEDVVFYRAKKKALNMLTHSDKTEKEIYNRLKEEYYNDDIIERTITYLKGYNYLNDERYAEGYINSRKGKESRLAIETKLLNKGINKSVLEKIIAKEYNTEEDGKDPEILAINKILLNKCDNPTKLSCEEKQKLIKMLERKGFDLDKIYKCM